MFSQRVEYALRAMIALALDEPSAKTTERIAVEMQVPQAYLFKILRKLQRAGLVATQRGNSGGVSLARSAKEISILDVISAIDPIERIDCCPLGLAEHKVRLCPLHRRLDRAFAGIIEAFDHTSLAEVLAEDAKADDSCQISKATSKAAIAGPRPKSLRTGRARRNK